MGLITGFLTLPIAPVRGVAWIGEKVLEQAELELYDEGRIVRELALLDAALDRGEIDEAVYDSRAEELLDRLELGRVLELERGMQVGNP